jgi:protein TonB
MRLSGTCARLAIVVLLHAAVLFTAFRPDHPRSATNAKPVIVSLISAPQPLAQEPRAPPAPKAVHKVPVKAPLPARSHVDAATRTPAPVPEPNAIRSEASPSATTAVQPEPAASAALPMAVAPPVAAASPAPSAIAAAVVAPRFDAAYLKNPAPVYPLASRRRQETGKVYLEVYVNAGGTADRVEIKTSSGYPVLDQAAKDAVQKWRFIPARQGGQAVNARVIVPIVFNLED